MRVNLERTVEQTSDSQTNPRAIASASKPNALRQQPTSRRGEARNRVKPGGSNDVVWRLCKLHRQDSARISPVGDAGTNGERGERSGTGDGQSCSSWPNGGWRWSITFYFLGRIGGFSGGAMAGAASCTGGAVGSRGRTFRSEDRLWSQRSRGLRWTGSGSRAVEGFGGVVSASSDGSTAAVLTMASSQLARLAARVWRRGRCSVAGAGEGGRA